MRQHTKEKLKEITFKIFTKEDMSISYYYEDEGEGYKHLKGKYKKMYFGCTGNQNSFECSAASEGKYKLPYSKYTFEIIGLEFEPEVVIIDGKKSKCKYDPERKTLIVKSSKMLTKIKIA